MKIDKGRPLHWMLLARQALFTALAIGLRPWLRAPSKPVVILYGHQFSGNLRALYQQWWAGNCDAFSMYFLALDPTLAQALERDGIATLSFGRLADLPRLASARVIVSDHGLHAMSPLTRLTNLRFIDVWHGIPFKGFVPEDFTLQHRYDEVWVSSPRLKALYEERFGFRAEQVRALGYARADRLFRRPPPASVFRSQRALSAATPLVLYAPTWQQDDAGREQFPFGETQASFTAALSDACAASGARLVVRSHLNSDIGAQDDRVIYCSQRDYADTEDMLLAADLLVCDWSSIAFDYLALARPTVFLDVPPPFRHGFSLGPEYRFGCVVDNTADLCAAVSEFLQTPERYHQRYAEQCRAITEELYADSTAGDAAQKQIERLQAMLREGSA
ncbi:MAG: CDP-glycerol glycerophosphotransferase family protein [Halioglobus sp.]|nr:CDP-glycerol glycerophosphotransferase family protein [Halioglobus sp.]